MASFDSATTFSSFSCDVSESQDRTRSLAFFVFFRQTVERYTDSTAELVYVFFGVVLSRCEGVEDEAFQDEVVDLMEERVMTCFNAGTENKVCQ